MNAASGWVAVVMAAFACHTAVAGVFPLERVDPQRMTPGWGTPQANASIGGKPMRIGAVPFATGLGTHSGMVLRFELDGRARRFTAKVGLDDDTLPDQGTAEFAVVVDGREKYASGRMRTGNAARDVAVDLSGARELVLLVEDGGDDLRYDHANWALAQIEYDGAEPRQVAPAVEEKLVLTPKPGPAPRINGARIVGARPGHPFLFTVPVTGERPMTIAVHGLPPGLSLDATNGCITGAVAARGEWNATVTARNAKGAATRDLRIVIGDRIALTPPMGWNSWNCFAHAVSQDKVLAAAEALVKSGLREHGWTYVNIDDYWQKKPSATNDPSLGGPGRDPAGRIVPNPRFPDMRGLAEQIHRTGLKFGIYSSPGPVTCGGCLGSFGHEEGDAGMYAEWGVDYLKYDWCSYLPELEEQRGKPIDVLAITKFWGNKPPSRREQLARPYAIMRTALDRQKRDIVYSLCQYGMGNVWEWGAQVGGDCWRTTGDIVDTWASMSTIGFGQAGREIYAGPGSWNDPDMLVVGRVGWGPDLHPTRLTPNEQYTHVSLWCLLAAPLLIGCDLTQLDEFTLGLLTNDEVIEVNQDPLGRQARPVWRDGELEVWSKVMEDGSRAVGLFNRGRVTREVPVLWRSLDFTGKARVRDLWRQRDVGEFSEGWRTNVPRHGCVLVRVFPAR